MSDSERPDLAAFRELEQLVRAMADEMATLRRRAQTAEARLRQTELEFAAGGSSDKGRTVTKRSGSEDARSRQELERENADLKRRLTLARERTEELVARVRFLRQQQTEAAT